MKPLTKREKILLYILAIIAIVAGIMMLIIKPALEQSDTLDETIMEKQMSIDSIRVSLQTQQALRDEIDRNTAGIAEESKFFFPVLTNNELDEYITGLLQTHGLTALSLAISIQTEEATADADAKAADADAAEAREPTFQEVQYITVATTARGTMRQFMLLVDTVKELDGIRITSIKNKQDPAATPAPTPKPSKKAASASLPLSPEPVAKERTYTMDIVFTVLEYADGKTTSVALDREE